MGIAGSALPRPLFVHAGGRAPERALAVDGTVAGCAATYSHWQGEHVTPAALLADTSTGMAVLAARDPARWLAPYAWVCNNHVDADGILSMIACCRPELAAAHGAHLIAAAECGDFTHWRGEAALDLALRVHALMRAEREGGAGWEQRALDHALREADALVAGEWPGAAMRADAIGTVFTGLRWLIGQWFAAPGPRAAPRPPMRGRLAAVAWPRVHGHAADHFAWLDDPRADDLPLLSLAIAIPVDAFQLLMERQEDGMVVRLDAPRHSWARTVALPAVAWPDLSAVAAELAAREPEAGWVARPQAAELGFTCLLGNRRPSRLGEDAVVAACAAVIG